MGQVVWSPIAAADLEGIYAFIARDSPRVADMFVERLRRATKRLADFPLSGRVVPEKGRDDIREIIVQPYRVVYRVLGEDVQVVTVRHGARQG